MINAKEAARIVTFSKLEEDIVKRSQSGIRNISAWHLTQEDKQELRSLGYDVEAVSDVNTIVRW